MKRSRWKSVETLTPICWWRRGRAHVRRDWHASYEAFVRAGDDIPLSTDDLDALAAAAWRLGRGKESVRVAERVFTQLARTDPPSAAMKAVDLALAWLTRGDLNIAAGLDEPGPPPARRRTRGADPRIPGLSGRARGNDDPGVLGGAGRIGCRRCGICADGSTPPR